MHFIRKLRLLKVEGRDWGLPWHMCGPIAPFLIFFRQVIPEHCIFASNTFVLPILSQQEMLAYHMMIVLYCVLIGALLPCADQVIGTH